MDSEEASLSIYPDSIKELRALCLKYYDVTKSYRGTKLQMKRRLFKAGVNLEKSQVSPPVSFTNKSKVPDLQAACLERGLNPGNYLIFGSVSKRLLLLSHI